MPYSDTPEQASIIGWSGSKLVVTAFVGSGKTSILVRFALAKPDSRMLYLAYNRAVRDDAEQMLMDGEGDDIAGGLTC
ncbi:Uncharacterised protein [Serratia proteamaculans]|jgi:superfamily I DNA and RNA helicase|nr:Uncharacterised protein [Serratia proteamaculans]